VSFDHHFEEKRLSVLTPLQFWNYKLGSGTVFYVSYQHSRTMYTVPMERGGKMALILWVC